MTYLQRLAAWWLDLPADESVEQVQWVLAAPWTSAPGAGSWLAVGVAAAVGLSLVFYLRFQSRGPWRGRLLLALFRGGLLATLLVTFAEPAWRVSGTVRQEPVVYVLFDGTESMTLRDPLPERQRRILDAATGHTGRREGASPSRMDDVRSWLRRAGADHPLVELERRSGYRLEPFLFDGDTTSRPRRLEAARGEDSCVNWSRVAEQLSAEGQVTSLGSVLADVARPNAAGRVAAVILVSDFAHNAGSQPLEADSAAAGLLENHPPIHTVGVGAVEAVDLALDVRTELKIRKGEETTVSVDLRQTGLTDRMVMLRVTAEPPGDAGKGREVLTLGERNVTLDSQRLVEEFSFTPAVAGRFRLQATADVLDDEVVGTNNTARTEVQVIEDYVRLLYAAYEPTWEWRFVKEVFHRDETVGMDGFRTYLASSDPRVRRTNPLFVDTLAATRREFFTNDVVFLDDMPRAALAPRFCEMLREFVGQLGGGLVVLAGPRFGPGELASTPLSDMLPVRVDASLSLRDSEPFSLQRTQRAAAYRFMRLGDSAEENERAWRNLGPLPWYQPVADVHPRAEVLAEHPADTCRDGRTRQPLVAIRRFGRGEVVYLGFNELWRLRRRYGERYYHRFWAPLIDRLGLSHALGSRKRFTARLDRTEYRLDEEAVLTVQVFDRDYAPLRAADVPTGSMRAELSTPSEPDAGPGREVSVPLVRDGLGEARIPVYTAGRHRLRVHDPLTDDVVDLPFEVGQMSAEHQSAVRNAALQKQLAERTGGRDYDLATAGGLADNLNLPVTEEPVSRLCPLWSTPVWFALLMTLLLGEWAVRQRLRLT